MNDITRMHNPPHPGETLREDILPELGLTVTEAALQLGVTRAALSRVLNGRAGISPEMALRLEAWLGADNGGRADLWLAMQAAYDLWQARSKGLPCVQRAVAHS
jgi:antitoxin HigA-1